MSNSDSFINEVSEEVRRDRLYKLFRKWGWIPALAVVLIVGGASVNEWRKAGARADAQAAGDALLSALENDDVTARASALAELDAGDNAARAAVLALSQADAALASGDRAGAVSTLQSLSDNSEAPAAFRDLATLKSVILGADEISPDDRIARLNTLSLGGGAFRLLAEEQIALAEIEKGETNAALDRLRDITLDASVTPDLRRRASQLIVALGGTLTEG